MKTKNILDKMLCSCFMSSLQSKQSHVEGGWKDDMHLKILDYINELFIFRAQLYLCKISMSNLLHLLRCIGVGLIQQTPIPTHPLFELKRLLEAEKQWGIAKSVCVCVCVGTYRACFCFQECGCGNSTHSVALRQTL